ncbi:DNA-binding winged helix-turn-helix (wHTH) domain-containing protein [Mesorhizobium albiziae]|uniref:DNA-binding winged helix-turn-helix (WHTH) domain-containing protein n=1 Tax=Neomesorhizobium albiziae TaxID=335020 RepID=A0A1I4D7I9_9HYPH|nr:winged helix-turn-helix domain-containing protein [Mesorhizobium albiziae]GLS33658.1 hypothetical protein GCM10007937_53700 [Mesorhizobium albiziae]SFK88790.1 DNA-binding winged helix-turn-helix (wHTH) domain-containing protein [Mesorhizobium albiziae]
MLLRLNGRVVDLRRGSVTDDGGRSITTLRPQAAETLKALAAKPGEIVTKDELMQTVWGNIAVSDDSLVQCVIEIRKALGDDKHRVVRTLPKRGYVLETKAIDDGRDTAGRSLTTHRRGSWIGLAAGLAVLVMGATAYFWPIPEPEVDRQAIAVLPVEKTNGDPAGKLDEMTARERVKVAALEEGLLAARREIDTLRSSVQTARSTREEALRRELAARREQGRAWQRADQLAGSLALAQREVERLKAEAVRRREAAETSLALAKRAFDAERQKVGLLERSLAVAHQSINALEASAKAAATVQATTTQRRQAAEYALMRAGETLTLERNKADALTRELDTARQEHDAAKDNVARVSTAIREALEQERARTAGLARELTAARNQIGASKARDTYSPSRRATASVPVGARPARQLGSQEIRKVEVRKPSRPVRVTTISLPDALLPVQ